MERKKIKIDELPHANRLVFNLMCEKMGSENKSGFARLLSEGTKPISEQRISRLFFIDKRSGKYPKVSDDIRERIIEKFGLSEDYFIRRKAEGGNKVVLPHREGMDLDDGAMPEKNAFGGLGGMERLAQSGFVCVPLVSAYAHAGYLCGYGDSEYLDSLPMVPFLPDRRMTGNYVAFEVKGDSMDDGTADSYKDGEVLICREVEPEYYRNDKLHISKRDFVIVHKDGILVKRIIAHDVAHHLIKIHSLNPVYKDETINLADVRQVFSVVSSQRSRQR